MFLLYGCWPVSWSASQQLLDGWPWDFSADFHDPQTPTVDFVTFFIYYHQNIKASLSVHQLTDRPVGVLWGVIIPNVNLIPLKLCNLNCTRGVAFHNSSQRNCCLLVGVAYICSGNVLFRPVSPTCESVIINTRSSIVQTHWVQSSDSKCFQRYRCQTGPGVCVWIAVCFH